MKNSQQESSRRLDEVYFIVFVQTLFKKSDNPMYVYDYIELMCGMCKIPSLHIQHVLTLILAEERSIMPSKKEQACLYRWLGYSVRTTCKFVGMSQRDYYKHVDESKDRFFLTDPRLSEEEDADIRTILQFCTNTFPRKRGDCL